MKPKIIIAVIIVAAISFMTLRNAKAQNQQHSSVKIESSIQKDIIGQSSLDKGKVFYESKKYLEAEKIFKSVARKTSDYASAQHYLGRMAFDKKAYDNAVDYFKEATEANSGQAVYFHELGNAYAEVAKESNVFTQAMIAPKVKNAWEKAIELDSKNIDAHISLIGFFTQVPGVLGGSMSKAKAIATEISKLNVAEGHWQMGWILAEEKNYTEAEKEFYKMVIANPAYKKNLSDYYIDEKQYEKAFELLEEILKKTPDDYLSLYRFGKAAALTGSKLDRGEEYLKKYLDYTPNNNEPSIARANVRLGQIKEKEGKKVEAKKYFEIALRLDTNLKEAKEGLDRISK